MNAATATGKSFVLAHISDPHFACVEHMQKRDFLTKRLLGYLRWKLKRQSEQNSELLTILHQDLQRTKPDHIVITGDLTQLGLPAEFAAARAWLQSLGTPDSVTIVPGNHDTYIQTQWQETFACWLKYMVADNQSQPAEAITRLDGVYPSLRIRGPIALIGINTAYPSRLHLADGTIGSEQLKKLETLLERIADQHLFRIILIHHPPLQDVISRRKSLTDASSLRMLLERQGAELVLFGHTHKTIYGTLEAASAGIPVMGAPAASSLSTIDGQQASYFLYEIASTAKGWKIHMQERIFSLEQWCFVDGAKQDFSLAVPQCSRSLPK